MSITRACDIMTAFPVMCTENVFLSEAAQLMAANDCGALPVVADGEVRRPVGIITDRDIVCRGVAKSANLSAVTVGDCMTRDPIAVTLHTELAACEELMEQHSVRRLLVKDDHDHCVGIISQADIVIHAPAAGALSVVRQVSLATRTPSRESHSA